MRFQPSNSRWMNLGKNPELGGIRIIWLHTEALQYFMRTFAVLCGFCLLLLFTACSSIEYNSSNCPKMVVVLESTPFYRKGPAQGTGPDLSLAKGDEVEVLRKEFGFSFVRIEDGQNGYIANESIKPAPPSTQVDVQKPQPQEPSILEKPSFRY